MNASMNKINRFLLVFFLSILGGSCSSPEDTAIAELAVEDFHVSYNAGNYKTIYINATDAFQNYVPQARFIRLLTRLKDDLGAHVTSHKVSWSVKKDLVSGTTNRLTYRAKYEKDSQARETFEFVIQDGVARLNNFNVASPHLAQRPSGKSAEF